MKRTFITFNMIVLAYGFSACEKFVQIDMPPDQLSENTVFSDSTNADAAILGNYINLSGAALGFGSGAVTVYTGLSSDELYRSSSATEYNEFFNNAVLPSNSLNTGLWVAAYGHIYSLNACIEGIENSTTISQDAKVSLIAEARFLRAFVYFQLVNLFGPVPLVTGVDYHQNRQVERSPEQLVYELILSDLLFARDHMEEGKPIKTRAGRSAAIALLAKVYLYLGNFSGAEIEASKIIDLEKFGLEEDLDHVFLASSRETILSLLPVYPNRETWEGYFFVPSSGTSRPTYVLTDALMESFEQADRRKAHWIKENIVSGEVYPFPYKYKRATASSGAIAENYVLLRLAEQFLIRGEARARLGKIAGPGSAEEDINRIRWRAGLTEPVRFISAEDAMQVIGEERKREMFCEWGSRWFDLKRTGNIDQVLGKVKPNWSSTASLYPVPLQELNANPHLTQNEGY